MNYLKDIFHKLRIKVASNQLIKLTPLVKHYCLNFRMISPKVLQKL